MAIVSKKKEIHDKKKFIFRDRLRTCVNVMGDGIGCGFVEHLSKVEPNEIMGQLPTTIKVDPSEFKNKSDVSQNATL